MIDRRTVWLGISLALATALAVGCGRNALNGNLGPNPDKSLFVSVKGTDSNAGTRDAPMRTIQAAIDAASALRYDVLISEGQYEGPVYLAEGVSLHGGYDPGDWLVRDSELFVTEILGGNPAITAQDLVFQTVLSGLHITADDAPDTQGIDGESSTGLHAINAASLILVNVTIWAGHGSDGARGAAGGAPAVATTGEQGGDASGQAGASGAVVPGTCEGLPETLGGVGGTGGTDSSGMRNGLAGAPGTGPGGGTGGNQVGSEDTGNDGGPGEDGVIGSHGFGGVGSGSVLSSGFWSPGTGDPGLNGTPGFGGGGGSGGGSDGGGFLSLIRGGGGGGAGGGGGCPGRGGAGGGGGGGSFGIFAVTSNITLQSAIIAAGNGGHGAGAGLGSEGGIGGAGGPGGDDAGGDAKPGGSGGVGGQGGQGGHGGGGAGGPSAAVWLAGKAVLRRVESAPSKLSFGTPGSAGAGGSENPGEDGYGIKVFVDVE